MAPEPHWRPGDRPQPAPTFFVGRRPLKLAELYALTAIGVERLSSRRRYGSAQLDWQGGDARVMELSHALLTRLTEQTPSKALAARFVVHVLMQLPEAGFVLDADQIRGWIARASEPCDWSPPEPCDWSVPEPARGRSWTDRLRRRGGRTEPGGRR